MAAFVLDRHGKASMPCTEMRARLLLDRGRARVHRLVPFVIRLVDRQATSCAFQPLRIKRDPGSQTAGMAFVRDTQARDTPKGDVQPGAAVLNLFELAHRGRQFSEALTARRQMRRRRRGNLRYRAPRFLNRGNKQRGWLAPSLKHRVDTPMAWVGRLQRWTPVTALGAKLVRFDLQVLQNPELSGIEYQQGTLAGYELRECLLEKGGRRGTYCDAQHGPLQIEHIHPKARGGSDRASNLCLSFAPCNRKKAAQPLERFLARDPKRLAFNLAQAQRPLKDAAAVNATGWALANQLKATGLAVQTASGGRTKFNRSRLGMLKTQTLDAACVRTVAGVPAWGRPRPVIQCAGRGSHQRTRLDKVGFPRGYLTREKWVRGFQALSAVLQGISHQDCHLIQRADGYGHSRHRAVGQTPTAFLRHPQRASLTEVRYAPSTV